MLLVRFAALGICIVVTSFVIRETQQTMTRRIPQLENDDVRVWKSVIMPHQPLSMHRHDHPRVIIALEGGSLKITKESGESRTVNWETGHAYWLPADPPGERHADVNETDKPIEVMVVEVKKRPD